MKQDYTGKISKLGVVLQTDTMQDAFMLGTAGTHESVVKKRELMARKFTSAVNGISAGAIKTLAASGIKDFGKLLAISANAAPMRRNVTIDEVGNVAAFLLSDLASGMTAQITYVDCGVSQAAVAVLEAP